MSAEGEFWQVIRGDDVYQAALPELMSGSLKG